MIPNTNLQLMGGYNGTIDMTHTLAFDSQSAQYTNLSYLVKATVDSFQVIKGATTDGGQIKVEVPFSTCYACNYMRFQNNGYSGKWFYAFITEVEYINDNTTLITYTIDEWQTWFFEIEWCECFVEREHSETDDYWEHIEPESLGYGDYINVEREAVIGSLGLKQSNIVTIASTGYSPLQIHSGIYNGVFQSVEFEVKNGYLDTALHIINYALTGNLESIVDIKMVYGKLFNWGHEEGAKTVDYRTNKYKGSFPCKDGSSYIPKNKKLYNYPYNLMHISTQKGDDGILRYEDFYGTPNTECLFGLTGVTSINPTVLLIPKNYMNGWINSEQPSLVVNYENRFVLDDFPSCSFPKSSYLDYMHQTMTSTAIGMGVKAGTGVGTITNVVNGTKYDDKKITSTKTPQNKSDLVSDTFNTYLQSATHGIQPSQLNGALSTNINFGLAQMDFWVTKKTISGDMAKTIDDYFQMFGYACRKVKVPNYRGTRPYFSYVRTINGLIKGDVPTNSKLKIMEALDAGTTFWLLNWMVGNYDVSNI